jgi:hypothetical protein
MGNGNFGEPVERLCASCDIVYGVNYLGAVIPHPTRVTNTNRNSLKNDEAFLVLKSLLIDLFRPNSTFAMLAYIAVWRLLSGIW